MKTRRIASGFLPILFLTISFVLSAASVESQVQPVWAKHDVDPGGFTSNSQDLVVDDKGNIYTAGIYGNSDYFISKRDSNGDSIWTGSVPMTYPFFTGFFSEGFHLLVGDDIVYLVTNENDTANSNWFFQKMVCFIHAFDTAGTFLWKKALDQYDPYRYMLADSRIQPDGSLATLISRSDTNSMTFDTMINRVYLFDKSGNMTWTQPIDTSIGVFFWYHHGKLFNDDQGKIYALTNADGFLFANYKANLTALDSLGSVKYSMKYTVANSYNPFAAKNLTNSADGGIYIGTLEQDTDTLPYEYYVKVSKLDSAGNLLWQNTVLYDTSNGGITTPFLKMQEDVTGNLQLALVSTDENQAPEIEKIVLDPSGNVIGQFQSDISGTISPWSMPNEIEFDEHYNILVAGTLDIITANSWYQALFACMLDSTANLIWHGNYGIGPFWGGSNNIEFRNGQAIVAGSSANSQFPQSAVTLDFCTDCFTYTQGKIWNDADSNCVIDSAENLLPNIIISAEPGQHYATTDSLGHYNLIASPGNYTVKPVTKPGWGIVCPTTGTQDANVPVKGDVDLNNDFGLQVVDSCAHLSVDIASGWLRKCTPTSYNVYYCNEGTVKADSVYIIVTFDSVVVPDSASPAWTSVSGYDYKWYLGDLNPTECGQIKIYATVSCANSAVNTTRCIEAHIYPEAACGDPADTIWDKSSVMVVGECVNDSLACFTIYNTGDPGGGDMAGTSDYRIYVNNVLVDSAKFQIAGGDSLVICWPAQGNTIRLEADQRPGHPGKSNPNDEIELCGNPNQVTGQINQLPKDDLNDFVAFDCGMVLIPTDPNVKTASPTGITQYNYIRKETELKYDVKFQNVGTDTAFRVVVLDTLSPHLDVTTLEMGAASAPYEWKIFGSGILEVRFNTIKLVDSATNEPGSIGYFKFKIHTRDSLPNGTEITNRCGIYFDFEEAVMTNTALSTICDYGVTKEVPQISASSNPVCGSDITLTASGLPGMVYWYKDSCDGAFIATGNQIKVNPTITTDYFARVNEGTCWSECGEITINSNFFPAPSNVSSSKISVCYGETIDLYATGDGSMNWKQGGCNGANVGIGDTITVAPKVSTTYFVQAENGNCQSVCKTINIIVNKPVSPTQVTASSGNVCIGDSTTLTATGGSGNVYWFADSCGTTPINSAASLSVNPITKTTYFAKTEVVGCWSSCISKAITVKPVPPAPSVSSNSPICEGKAISLTSNYIQNVGYLWTGPNGFSSTSQNPVIAAGSPNMAGSYTAQTLSNGCKSSPATTIVTVHPNNFVSISTSADTICEGDTVTLTAIGANIYNWVSTDGTSSGFNSPVKFWPNINRTYIVTGTGTSTGCDGKDTVSIHVEQAPIPSITQVGTNLESSIGQSYQWFMNGVPIPGANSATFAPNSNGNYSVQVIYPNGCYRTSADYPFISTAIQNGAIASEIQVYPNPFENTVHLKFEVTGSFELRVLDMTGRVIFKRDAAAYRAGEMISIDLEKFSSASFVLEVQSATDTYRYKLIRTP